MKIVILHMRKSAGTSLIYTLKRITGLPLINELKDYGAELREPNTRFFPRIYS